MSTGFGGHHHTYAEPLGRWSIEAACLTLVIPPVDEKDALDPDGPARRRLAVFFESTGEDRFESDSLAKAVCSTCPVRADCLLHAIVTKDDYGVWGGTVPDQRKRIRRYLVVFNERPTIRLMGILIDSWLTLPRRRQDADIRRRRPKVASHG